MNYKEVIESKYNREAWQKLLYDIFRNKISFWNTPSAVHVSSRLAKEALNLGKISLVDGESIAIYEVELSDKVDIERNRRGIRDMLTTDWRNMGYAGAFMFCYRKDESILRFSYVSETWGFNKQGEYEKMSTNTKRYTYLLGEGRGCRTAIEQFGTLKNSKQTLSDITNAFSVETLTKQFYKDLFEWYQWAIEPSSNVSFPNNTGTEDDDREDLETKVIRLITRIMFVWFIKQKDLVPQRIFDIDYLQTILKEFDPYSQTVGNYYNAILQNLFFATLNRAIEDEQGNKRKFATNIKKDIKTLYRYAEMFNISENDVVTLFSEVPFLNGGLFECLDKTKTIDGVEQAYNYDGFSRNDKRFADGRYRNRAIIPNNLFFDSEKGPILRGRDIRRYEYEWADKYLIATFPSRHYDIELYPAVKRHLLSFGKERLEQTGKTYSINGEKIKARKKTHNKWFETQDSISYWEDFMRPKIIWKRIGSILRFSYDTTGNFGLDSTCFATGQHMAYLCCILNSLMGHYMFKDSPKTGTGDLLVSVQAIEPILIPMNKDMECLFENLLEEVLKHRSEETEKEINRLAFKLYDLSPAEINYITDFVTQSQQSQ